MWTNVLAVAAAAALMVLPVYAAAAGAPPSPAERWLGQLRMGRFWPQFERLGVLELEDYLLVEPGDLDEFRQPGMKPIHKRKFWAAVRKLDGGETATMPSSPQSWSFSSPPSPPGDPHDASLSHATELMSTKLRRTRLGKLIRDLEDVSDPGKPNDFEDQARELRDALLVLQEIASSYDTDLQDATMEGLEAVLGDPEQLDAYFARLKDLRDLKTLAAEGILGGADLSAIGVDDLETFFEEPEVLQAIIDEAEAKSAAVDQEKEEREKETANTREKETLGGETVAAEWEASADWESCGTAGVGVATTTDAVGVDGGTATSSNGQHYTTLKFDDASVDLRRAEAHFQLGHLLQTEGRMTAAAEEYRRCLKIAPTHATALHMLAVATGSQEYKAATPSYVEMLFDSYAQTYDEHLVDKLKYRVPHLLIEHVSAALADNPTTDAGGQIRPHKRLGDMDIVDCGCGTGLFGRLLREREDIKGRLVGVDMSSKMLDKARETGMYTGGLHHGTIEEWGTQAAVAAAAGEGHMFDLAVLGDVLGYIGSLESTLAVVVGRLREGGVMGFTVETENEDVPWKPEAGRRGYRIEPKTSRFKHASEYVRHAAAQAGLNLLAEHDVVLRHQMRVPVRGKLFVWRKSN